MERYGSITTPVSIPRFIIGGMLVGRRGRGRHGFPQLRTARRDRRRRHSRRTLHPVGHAAQSCAGDARTVRDQLLHHGADPLRPRPAVRHDPRCADILQHPDNKPAGHDAPHRMETRQLRADRRRGDLGGVLRARSGQPRIGFGFGMVLVREVRGVLLLLYRGAHPAHDERIQVPEIHARHLVRPDADRRGQSLASRSSSASTPPKTTGCSFSADARRTSSTAGSGISRSSATPPTSAARWDFRWSSFRSRRSITAIRG